MDHDGPCAALPTFSRKLRRLWARMTGRVLVSDHVVITVSDVSAVPHTEFNPDMIIGKLRK
jgi:hypothetical protein